MFYTWSEVVLDIYLDIKITLKVSTKDTGSYSFAFFSLK